MMHTHTDAFAHTPTGTRTRKTTSARAAAGVLESRCVRCFSLCVHVWFCVVHVVVVCAEFVGTILRAVSWKWKKKKKEGYEVRFADGVERIPTEDLEDNVVVCS